MAEQLYTIPVNDAFDIECECPMCAMYRELEKDAVAFSMGSSYMDDQIREKTDKEGFCSGHAKQIYEYNNSLGMAMVLDTHVDKIIRDVIKLNKKGQKSGLFKKKDMSGMTSYLKGQEDSCFICNKIKHTFERYLITVYHMWKNDEDFKDKYEKSKGFCITHYRMLLEHAPSHLTGKLLDEYIHITNKIFMDNLERVSEELKWFINKFDYKYKEEPWKNSKDALPRMIEKLYP